MNTLIKRIIFATDLSETARDAFNYAVTLADRFESELIVVHVIKKDMAYTAGIVRMGLGEDLYKDMEQKKAQSARDLLIGKRTEAHVFGEQIHQYCTEAEQGLKRSKPLKVTDMVIEAASISEEIMKLVESQACDMIVL
ncbi:MAG: universal stress protein, partial [Desulfobacterales bacterium]|nr:universal stress protein [Desulfobacterales bacterium]